MLFPSIFPLGSFYNPVDRLRGDPKQSSLLCLGGSAFPMTGLGEMGEAEGEEGGALD